MAAVTMVVAGLAWQWSRGNPLPPAPANAANYYALGIEALRDGTFALARNNFEEAIALFPDYVQAYSGLAQAHMELDDQDAAQRALLKVTNLVPDRTRLSTDDRLRLEGVLASVQRAHDVAIDNYGTLVERHPRDAGAWLDLGRAKEAAERHQAARGDYEQALALDPQSPAVHVHLGVLLVNGGRKDQALPFFDEAVRLYRVRGNVEGEAEALLRKGTALNNTGQLAEASDTLDQVVGLAGDRYLSQRARAQFELARVAAQLGRPEEALKPTEDAIQDAASAGLFGIAANGRIDYAMLFLVDDLKRADTELERTIEFAAEHGARRTEMRAQLQRAFLRASDGNAEEAVTLAESPLAFYGDGRYPLQEAVARNIVSRAREALGELDEASRLASGALAFADSIGDPALANDSLQNLGSQFAKLGRLPEALSALERSAAFYREQAQVPSLAYTLLKQAEILILLGRGQESEAPLTEVERGIATNADTNPRQPRRVARLRTLRAVTEGRYADAEAQADLARAPGTATPDGIDRSARVLAEYAAARLGHSRTSTEALLAWPGEATSPGDQSELSFWVAQTLRVRHEDARAREVAATAWPVPAAQANAELRWRLAALAADGSDPASGGNGAIIPASAATTALEKLKTLWGQYDAAAYFARADLKPLLESRIP